MESSAMIGLIDPLRKIWRDLYGFYKKTPSHYLEGRLTTGLDVAYRVLGLFEAHGVKRTQIYRILGESFPDITPSLDAEKLQGTSSGDSIWNLGVRYTVPRTPRK